MQKIPKGKQFLIFSCLFLDIIIHTFVQAKTGVSSLVLSCSLLPTLINFKSLISITTLPILSPWPPSSYRFVRWPHCKCPQDCPSPPLYNAALQPIPPPLLGRPLESALHTESAFHLPTSWFYLLLTCGRDLRSKAWTGTCCPCCCSDQNTISTSKRKMKETFLMMKRTGASWFILPLLTTFPKGAETGRKLCKLVWGQRFLWSIQLSVNEHLWNMPLGNSRMNPVQVLPTRLDFSHIIPESQRATTTRKGAWHR